MKKFLFYLVQFTWALPQNLVGGIAFLILKGKYKHDRFHNAFVTYIPRDNFGGVSLGIFIFMNPDRDAERVHDTRIHEYGHTIQSLLLGPVWPFVIALPSVIWCNTPKFVRMRKEQGVSYYKLYCEGWANIWGRAWSGEEFISRDMKEHARYGRPIEPLGEKKRAHSA